MIRGSVQGVGFRMAAAAEARRLGVTGHARNLLDRTVEVEAEGVADAVEAMAGWLAHGPGTARVDGVESTEVEARGDSGFDVA
ncbi:acylphosphatase [Agrococcus sp. Ld7]|uniref:acylphosphatase n=1 Tax=Agrococcus sp. Ld7 TaxID=649148 RepID=UPI0038692A53